MDVEVEGAGDAKQREGFVRHELFREARRCLRRSENALVWSSAFYFCSLLILPLAAMAGPVVLFALVLQLGLAVAVFVFQTLSKQSVLRWSTASQELLRDAPEGRAIPWEIERTERSSWLVAHRVTSGFIYFEFIALLCVIVLIALRAGPVGVLVLPIAVFVSILVYTQRSKFDDWARGKATGDDPASEGDPAIRSPIVGEGSGDGA